MLSTFVLSNRFGFYGFIKSLRKIRISFEKPLRLFFILIGCKNASRNFGTNHSIGSRLCLPKELSGNFKVDKTFRYFVQLSCVQKTLEKGKKIEK